MFRIKKHQLLFQLIRLNIYFFLQNILFYFLQILSILERQLVYFLIQLNRLYIVFLQNHNQLIIYYILFFVLQVMFLIRLVWYFVELKYYLFFRSLPYFDLVKLKFELNYYQKRLSFFQFVVLQLFFIV